MPSAILAPVLTGFKMAGAPVGSTHRNGHSFRQESENLQFILEESYKKKRSICISAFRLEKNIYICIMSCNIFGKTFVFSQTCENIATFSANTFLQVRTLVLT